MLETFLEPDLRGLEVRAARCRTTAREWLGLGVGAMLGIVGFAIAYVLYERRAGYTLQLRDRFRPVHDFFFNKWGFDDLYDRAVRAARARASGSSGRDVFESAFVQGVLVGGTAGLVRAGTQLRARDPERLPARLRDGAADRRRRARPLLPAGEL